MDASNEKRAVEEAQKEFVAVNAELDKMLNDFANRQNALNVKLNEYYQKRSKHMNTPK